MPTTTSGRKPPSRQPQQYPTTLFGVLALFIDRFFDMIKDAAGDSKKVCHCFLLIMSLVLPIAAVVFWLHLDAGRWAWVLGTSGAILGGAVAKEPTKKVLANVSRRRSARKERKRSGATSDKPVV
jgi:hypothetical protein